MNDFITPLSSPSSRERARAAVEAGRVHSLNAEKQLRELLADSSPFVSRHAGRVGIGEVRFSALEALQKVMLAHDKPMDLGDVVVRKSMSADDVRELVGRLSAAERASVASRVEEALRRRVAPEKEEEELLRDYLTLQELGRVPYRTERVDAHTYTTPLQEEVRRSQLVSPRPRPHLRVADARDPERLFGYVYRGQRGLFVFDFAEGVGSDHAVQILTAVMRPRIQRVVVENGVTVRNPDGTAQWGDMIECATADPIAVLQSLRAYIENRYHTAIVT